MEDYSFDLQRILVGSMPLLFYAEILLRTALLYGYTLLFIRVIGRRNAGELTPLDLVIVISLGAAAGEPMLYPDVPVLHGMAVISVVSLLQRTVLGLSNRNEGVERIVKGAPIRLVQDGMLDQDGLLQAHLSAEEVFMTLRQEGYHTLGQVERLYIETDGKASIFPFTGDKAKPGLPITPPWDIEPPTFYETGQPVPQTDHYSCKDSGATRRLAEGSTFPPHSGNQTTQWTRSSA